MKTRLFYLFLMAAALGCSKSDDSTPAPNASGGCTVSFKGTTYSFTSAICVDGSLSGQPTIDGLTATDATATKAFIIARDSADPTSNSVSLNLNVSGSDVYVAAEGITSQPTITRSGKNWTFSGTASNGTDSGPISGSCTCSN
ncbi:MAG: hypothetical protein JNN04_04060 [Cyclobacteriaceae bacterium]|nr:hypothetical protein [Cyclobacteriaceae bacterium]